MCDINFRKSWWRRLYDVWHTFWKILVVCLWLCDVWHTDARTHARTLARRILWLLSVPLRNVLSKKESNYQFVLDLLFAEKWGFCYQHCCWRCVDFHDGHLWWRCALNPNLRANLSHAATSNIRFLFSRLPITTAPNLNQINTWHIFIATRLPVKAALAVGKKSWSPVDDDVGLQSLCCDCLWRHQHQWLGQRF